ncbi:MAG TPA: zf-HC2 domain-containing protein, partial [Gemmatimonadales bacterium]
MTDTMDTTRDTIDCERFEELLPDYLEGTLPPAAAGSAETHRAACTGCATLADDLESIRDAAAALPAMEPSRDLWDGIESRIAAPVLPLEGAAATIARRPQPARAPRVVAWPRRPWL